MSRNSCPGSADNEVSSDGAPRKIDGIKSRNVWVIAIEIMKIRRVVGWRVCVKVKDRSDIATRFIWRPGISPVRVPVVIPMIKGRIRFNIC